MELCGASSAWVAADAQTWDLEGNCSAHQHYLLVMLFYPSITLCESRQHGAQQEQKQRTTEREEQQQGETKSKEQKQVCMPTRRNSFLKCMKCNWAAVHSYFQIMQPFPPAMSK